MIAHANFFLTEGYVMILEAALVVVNRGGEVFGIVVELNSRQRGQAVVSCPQDGWKEDT